MQLGNQVEWALHCVSVLAGLPADRYLPTQALAEFHGVPKAYLSKALQALSRAAIVEGTLGPSGGYRLARSPEDITFLDVVEAVDGKGPSFVCTEIRRKNPCRAADFRDPRPCAVAREMFAADRAWRDHLRGVRLSDLNATLERDLPPELLERSAVWVSERC